MVIAARAETFGLRRTFTIARGGRDAAEVVRVTVSREGVTGQGECVPYARYCETAESVLAQIRALPERIERAALQSALPAGAARNAVDCALWDWQAKHEGRRVWQLAGLPAPGPVTTAFTLSLEAPEAMRRAAAEAAERPLLKVKLGTPDDLPRLEAVRAGAPAARLIVDANEGWTAADYARLAPELARLGVEMVEQPLPAGEDAALAEMPHPVPVCADESLHTRADLPALAGRYEMINVKLDKTGGLTEALALTAEARAGGLGLMVGCMVGTSLAMAPAVLLAGQAAITDLDGPLLLAGDRVPGLVYEGSLLHPPEAALWG